MATRCLAVRSAWQKLILFKIADANRYLTGSNFDVSNDFTNFCAVACPPLHKGLIA